MSVLTAEKMIEYLETLPPKTEVWVHKGVDVDEPPYTRVVPLDIGDIKVSRREDEKGGWCILWLIPIKATQGATVSELTEYLKSLPSPADTEIWIDEGNYCYDGPLIHGLVSEQLRDGKNILVIGE